MEARDVILKCYQDWQEIQEVIYGKQEFANMYTEKKKRAMFLSNGIIGIATYDGDLDLYFGQMILETMLHIHAKTVSTYIQDEDNYKRYIQSANYIISMLEWGSSIRGAWFNTYGTLTIDMPLNIPEIQHETFEIRLSEEFLHWFLHFLQNNVS